MTSNNAEASDIDLADQAVPADDLAEDADVFGVDIPATIEADPTDVLEQHRIVPSGEDDYDR